MNITATATFNIQDIIDARPEIETEAEAETFMAQNSRHIEAAMVRAGFEAIEALWVEAEA